MGAFSLITVLKERFKDDFKHWFKDNFFSKSSGNPQSGGRSILPIPTTHGYRTSTMATRTTTTRTTATMFEQSANSLEKLHMPFEITFDELIRAYNSCRKNKTSKKSTLLFEVDLEENLWNLYTDLINGNYKTTQAVCFGIFNPTAREVWASNFQDRIVHHLLIDRLMPAFKRKFHQNSCACIKGRGTLYGILKLERMCRSITQNYSKHAFYLKCDISNFFMSINQTILKNLINKNVNELWIREGLNYIIDCDLRKNYVLNTHSNKMKKIKDAKCFSKCEIDYGLPIGNLTSQFFANLYLNELDQFIKHTLKLSFYVRYVDDFLILNDNPRKLWRIKLKIDKFILDKLSLVLNPKKCFINRIEKGVSFCGQTLKPFRRIVRFSSKKRMIGAFINKENPKSLSCYFGIFRQASKSFWSRCILKHLTSTKGFLVDSNLTKIIGEIRNYAIC